MEKWKDGEIVERFVRLMPSIDATYYALKGYSVFDFTESLNMEPEYFETKVKYSY
jgi:hypothetical protein